jgi:hypothetical protein
MCGIGAFLSYCEPVDALELKQRVASALEPRGPDVSEQMDMLLPGGSSVWLAASVLHMRGEQMR